MQMSEDYKQSAEKTRKILDEKRVLRKDVKLYELRAEGNESFCEIEFVVDAYNKDEAYKQLERAWPEWCYTKMPNIRYIRPAKRNAKICYSGKAVR